MNPASIICRSTSRRTWPGGRDAACGFEDVLAEGSADWKKSGCILKIILFDSYARSNWLDEPLTVKGYRSDFDLLVRNNGNCTQGSGETITLNSTLWGSWLGPGAASPVSRL